MKDYTGTFFFILNQLILTVLRDQTFLSTTFFHKLNNFSLKMYRKKVYKFVYNARIIKMH